MFSLYPEQLSKFLNKNGLHRAYLLVGNDSLLLQESYNTICKFAKNKNFNSHRTFQLKSDTDWYPIFSMFQTRNLFTTRQSIQLILPENGSNVVINKYLLKLVNLLHDDLLLILRCNNLNKIQKQSSWFTMISSCTVQIICLTPKQENLQQWVAMRAKNINLEIDSAACQFLCYYYGENLLALAQVLEISFLLWPDNKLTLSRIEKLIFSFTNFTPLHWIEALFVSDSKRALYILQHLLLKGNEPAVLLHILQKELLILVKLKYQLTNKSLDILFNKYQIWQNHRMMITKALTKFSKSKLNLIIQLLSNIEIMFKQNNYEKNYDSLMWNELKILSLLLS